MRNIGLQERLAKAAAAVGRGALPVLASGLQSRISTLPCPVSTSKLESLVGQWTLPEYFSSSTYLRMRSLRDTIADSQDSTF